MTPSKLVWQNGYNDPINYFNRGYHYLKVLGGGDLPMMMCRVEGGEALTDYAVNIFPDANLTREVIDSALRSSIPRLEDLMASRAVQIIELVKASPKKTLVWWSGGLDSTAILATLRTFAEFDQLTAAGKLAVACSSKSQEEYPRYFAELQRMNVPMVEADLSLYVDPNFNHLDGMWADELFGNYQAEKYGESLAAGDLVRVVQSRSLHHALILRTVERMAEVEKLFPAETLFQRLWWLEYSVAYQDANLRPFYNGSNRTTGENTRLCIESHNDFRWFSHPEFIQWSIARQVGNRFKTYRECKQCLRDYILSLTGDLDYCVNKPKVYSQGELYFDWNRRLSPDYTPIPMLGSV